MVIPFAMGTHQCDPLGGELFALFILRHYVLQLIIVLFVYSLNFIICI